MRPTVFPLWTRQIGEGQPCFVLAEVASAHGGSCDRALRMIESAFKMGADGIKFQVFRADQLVSIDGWKPSDVSSCMRIHGAAR